jgi:hypothetical protein
VQYRGERHSPMGLGIVSWQRAGNRGVMVGGDSEAPVAEKSGVGGGVFAAVGEDVKRP